MEKETKGTGRRTLLQRALALVAGGVALGSGVRLSRGSPVQAAEAGSTFTLHARTRPFAAPPNSQAPGGSALTTSGELLDGPQGNPVGSFVTNCFCDGRGAAHNVLQSGLEFQALQLKDGTLYGMCAGRGPDGSKAHAIIGGTGRFTGARGTYVERAAATRAAGRGMVTFTVTLAV